MNRRLPPLNPLRAFEAAARLGSLTRAAEEIGVSQVAVSRQVRVLEHYLGVALFQRSHRAIELTRAGRELRDGATSAFETIAASMRRISRRGRQNVLSIQSYTTFSQRWLIPRLPDFQRKFPGIEIRLTSSTEPVDFASGQIDAAIRSGLQVSPDLETERLAAIELLPVCVASLARDVPLRRPRDLRHCTMLYSLIREKDWAEWLAANRCGALTPVQEIRFESSALAYEAALRGLGVAMGIKVLVERDLQAGTLVAPFPRAHALKDAYYLVRPKARAPSIALQHFRTWLARELTAEYPS